MVSVEGSVRVDLLGGTLDIAPINLILKNALTLNLATSLKAKVEVFPFEKEGIEIQSKDYQTTKYFPAEDFSIQKLESGHFGHFSKPKCSKKKNSPKIHPLSPKDHLGGI